MSALPHQHQQETSVRLGWVDQLPPVFGRYTMDAKMAEQTWFRVGGPTDVLFRPRDVEDLENFLKNKPLGIPVTVVGAGSNMLVRDQGISGVVIRLLGKGFSDINVTGTTIEAGAGCLDRTLALKTAEYGIGGLEFLVGIPGTLGGAVRMNAGAYGSEIKDVLQWIDAVDTQGVRHRLTTDQLHLTYRHSDLPENWIITRVCLQGFAKNTTDIDRQLQDFLAAREATQPVRGRTGGSTFKNPDGYKAWELIDRAGCRGLRQGGAEVSEKHCNFLLNTGAATAADLENLGETVRQKVKELTGVDLEWEIIRLGS